MFCAKCGVETKEEHVFCPACGNNLKPLLEQTSTSSMKKNIGGSKKVVIGILVVLVGCVTGFFAFSFFKGGPDPINSPPIVSKDSQIFDQEVLRSLALKYTKAWAEAVNKNDFSVAEKYLLPGSALFNSQKELLSSFQKDKVRLQLIKTDIGEISSGSDRVTAIINVFEEYNVFSGRNRQVSRCYWTYTARYVQGQGWKLSGIEEDVAHKADVIKPLVVMREYKQDWIHIQYPQVEKLASEAALNKINTVLKKRADEFFTGMKKVAELSKSDRNYDRYRAEASYTVAWQTADTLSLVCHTYTYTGGAHGLSSETGYTFDLRTGDLITLRDKVGNEKIRSYNDLILQQIRAKNITIFEPFKGIGDKTTYYLVDNQILIVVFQQYEIAPYSSGILRFELPY